MAIIGGVTAASQAVAGAQQAKSAKDALANLKVPELKNPYENMQVSTMGADVQRQESARGQAADIEALQGAGARGLVGGVGRVQAQSNLENQEIAADLDKQQKAINMQKGQADMSIMEVNEKRFTSDKSALSSQINQGNQAMWAGINGVAQAGMTGVENWDKSHKNTLGKKGVGDNAFNPNAVQNQIAPNPTAGYNSSSIFTLK